MIPHFEKHESVTWTFVTAHDWQMNKTEPGHCSIGYTDRCCLAPATSIIKAPRLPPLPAYKVKSIRPTPNQLSHHQQTSQLKDSR